MSERTTNGKILIVGGYGAVGRTIAIRLAEAYPGQVIVAGRRYEMANRLAQASEVKIQPLQVDIFKAHQTPEILHGVALVVMCLDQPDIRFVELCLNKGVNYVDVTATYDFLTQVEVLDEAAKVEGSTAVLSVGLAPGMTNLLARRSQTHFDELQSLDIYTLLGLGEAHGEAAVRWLVENLNTTFTVQEDGTTKQVKNFTNGQRTVFPGKLGQRTAYRFDFPEQHVLPRTMGVASVSTHLAFDSALVTNLIAFGRKIGLFSLLRYQWVQNALVKLFTSLHFGSEIFVIQVDAQGLVNAQPQALSLVVTGEREAHFTGLVVAQVADQLMKYNYPPGVFHVEQLFEPRSFITTLAEDGLQFHQRVHPDGAFA
jgi:saccharopine dehydrogenase-like NADP-dependent oxidoreductase